MEKSINSIINRIKIHRRIRKFLTVTCLLGIIFGLLSFLFFGVYINSNAIKFIAQYANDKNVRLEKVMINPRIKFEHLANDYYDLKAKTAVHKNDDQIVLINVEADGSSANIKAGKLVISQNGENLIFSDNPVLIIKKKPN